MIFYGSQLSQNVVLPTPFSDYEDDPLQMGGNVIFDSRGKLVFLYASKYPADRPSIEDLMSILRKLY